MSKIKGKKILVILFVVGMFIVSGCAMWLVTRNANKSGTVLVTDAKTYVSECSSIDESLSGVTKKFESNAGALEEPDEVEEAIVDKDEKESSSDYDKEIIGTESPIFSWSIPGEWIN